MMQLNFSFNPAVYNLWEIYEAIHYYYPIGISRTESGIYYHYPGFKELEKLLVENIHDSHNFKNNWEDFTLEIQQEFGKEVINTTYGQAPSYSASLTISKNTMGDCTLFKKLNFSVSLLGKFYQIYGIDETVIRHQGEGKPFISVNVVTTSPLEAFEAAFTFVESKLKLKFPQHKMIPYAYGQSMIHGLALHYVEGENCTVNQALFNQFLGGSSNHSTRGNEYYGSEVWKIREAKEGKWEMYPPKRNTF